MDLPAGSLYFLGCYAVQPIRKQGLGKALPNKYDRQVCCDFKI